MKLAIEDRSGRAVIVESNLDFQIRQHILRVFRALGMNKSKTASALGISRSELYRFLTHEQAKNVPLRDSDEETAST